MTASCGHPAGGEGVEERCRTRPGGTGEDKEEDDDGRHRMRTEAGHRLNTKYGTDCQGMRR